MTEENKSKNKDKNPSVYELLRYSPIKILESLKVNQLKNKGTLIALLIGYNALTTFVIVTNSDYFRDLEQNKEKRKDTIAQVENKTKKEYYEKNKLVKIDMNHVCKFLKKENEQFREILKKKFNNQEIKDISIRAILRNTEEYKNTWPVFRWACEAETEEGVTAKLGIALDEFCKEFGGGYISKASFKNYEDENSWYCVAVPGDYTDEIEVSSSK